MHDECRAHEMRSGIRAHGMRSGMARGRSGRTNAQDDATPTVREARKEDETGTIESTSLEFLPLPHADVGMQARQPLAALVPVYPASIFSVLHSSVLLDSRPSPSDRVRKHHGAPTRRLDEDGSQRIAASSVPSQRRSTRRDARGQARQEERGAACLADPGRHHPS